MMATDPKTLEDLPTKLTGTTVFRVRDAWGWTRKEMADIIGTSVSAVSRWEELGDGAVRTKTRRKQVIILMDLYRQDRGADTCAVRGFQIRTTMLISGSLVAFTQLMSELLTHHGALRSVGTGKQVTLTLP